MIEIRSLRKLIRSQKINQLKSLSDWGVEFFNSLNFADEIYFSFLIREVRR